MSRCSAVAFLLGALVAGAFLLGAPRLAAAEPTVTFEAGSFKRDNDPNFGDGTYEGNPLREEASDGINIDECTAGEIWHLEATTTDASGLSLYVYAGEGCNEAIRRDGDDDNDCWEIAPSKTLSAGTEEHTFDIAADEIAVDGGTCTDKDQNIQIWLLILETASSETPAASVSYPGGEGAFHVDMVPPRDEEGAQDVEITVGEEQLEVSWREEVDALDYFVVCSPIPGAQGSAGTCEDAPPTEGFEAGAPFDRAWRCDNDEWVDPVEVSPVGVEGLENDTPYWVAVVTVDPVGNAGTLSEVVCAAPAPVTDFFEQYRAAGGRGGGGLCAAGPGRPAAGGALLATLVLLCGLLVRRRRRTIAALGAAAAVLAIGSPAAAQEGLRYLQDEHRSVQNFAFELRAGPYSPAVDDEFDGGARPYDDTFGDNDRLRLGLEFDWQALRTPVGTLGAGIGIGYSRFAGKSRFEETGEESAEETALNVIPIVVNAVFRLDVAMREWQIPLVPYGKIGIGTYLWYVSDGDGTAQADEGGEVDAVLGSGRTHGLELAGGVALLLDFIEPGSARKLDADTGVNHSYVFLEIAASIVDGFGSDDVLILSDTNWVAGLMIEI